MYRLTDRRHSQARDALERYRHELHDNRYINCDRLEEELRELWHIGYQELKDIFEDMLRRFPQYEHLAAYYMENVNPTGVVSEFQDPLAKLYGIDWYYAANREAKRDEYWARAFAINSEFDVSSVIEGCSILDVSSVVRQRLIDHFIRNPEELYRLPSRSFEELMAELFEGFGYRVELTATTRDNGRDIIAIGNTQISKSKFLIECKRYAKGNKVGVIPVRALHGVVSHERATKGIIVTTSHFTTPARKFIEEEQWTLDGRDFDGLLEWLKTYQRLRH